jgi:hypothetical protein
LEIQDIEKNTYLKVLDLGTEIQFFERNIDELIEKDEKVQLTNVIH